LFKLLLGFELLQGQSPALVERQPQQAQESRSHAREQADQHGLFAHGAQVGKGHQLPLHLAQGHDLNQQVRAHVAQAQAPAAVSLTLQHLGAAQLAQPRCERKTRQVLLPITLADLPLHALLKRWIDQRVVEPLGL